MNPYIHNAYIHYTIYTTHITYIHAYIHTYIHTYRQTDRQTDRTSIVEIIPVVAVAIFRKV